MGYNIGKETVKPVKPTKTLEQEYEKLTKCVRDTIAEVVSERKRLKKNDRVVTQATRDLFDKRAKEYGKRPPTTERRKRWNKVIRNACTNDYRRWVSNWVETIEKADHKGDTKAIYSGVKALSGTKRSSSKRPTMREVTSCEARNEQSGKGTAENSNAALRASAAKSVTRKTRRASTETPNENAHTEAVTENNDVAASEKAYAAKPETKTRVRIGDPEELTGV